MDSPQASLPWQQTGWERSGLLSSSPVPPGDAGAGVCDTWSPWRLWFMVDFQKGLPLTLAACRLTIFSLGWKDFPSGFMSSTRLTPTQSFWETLLIQLEQESLKQSLLLTHLEHLRSSLLTNMRKSRTHNSPMRWISVQYPKQSMYPPQSLLVSQVDSEASAAQVPCQTALENKTGEFLRMTLSHILPRSWYKVQGVGLGRVNYFNQTVHSALSSSNWQHLHETYQTLWI